MSNSTSDIETKKDKNKESENNNISEQFDDTASSLSESEELQTTIVIEGIDDVTTKGIDSGQVAVELEPELPPNYKILGLLPYLPLTPLWPVIVGLGMGFFGKHYYLKHSGFQAMLIGLAWGIVPIAMLFPVIFVFILPVVYGIGTIIVTVVSALLTVIPIVGWIVEIVIIVVWVVIMVVVTIIVVVIVPTGELLLIILFLLGFPLVLIVCGLLNFNRAPVPFTIPPFASLARKLIPKNARTIVHSPAMAGATV